MRAIEIRELLRATPFQPIRLGLSDGRYLLIRHPDQAIVAGRYLVAGVVRLGRSEPLFTPDSSETIARDVFWLDLVHVVSVEPDDAAAA
jgi:hypothetical protein